MEGLQKIKWRGTYGVGDFMQALNVCHRYCYDYNLGQVNLEMHWEHDEDYIYHPKDPETIVERMTWIHEKYKEPERVLVTHVFNSMEFHYDDVDQKVKRRFEFDNDRYDPTGAPPNDWVFAEREWQKPEKRIVIWTPSYNKEQPRRWKRWLTEDDWSDIIELLRWDGWVLTELTYRTPIRAAYDQIQRCKFVVSYDGMWHYIARNFCKPHLIPSKEGITTYNTPQAYKLKSPEDMKEFFLPENLDANLKKMNDKAKLFKDDLIGSIDFQRKV